MSATIASASGRAIETVINKRRFFVLSIRPAGSEENRPDRQVGMVDSAKMSTEGAAQLSAKIDLAAVTGSSTGVLPTCITRDFATKLDILPAKGAKQVFFFEGSAFLACDTPIAHRAAQQWSLGLSKLARISGCSASPLPLWIKNGFSLM